LNFDNTIPYQQAIDLAKKVASGDLSIQVVKEACWVLGCTIESLDGNVPPPLVFSPTPGNELAQLQLQAEEISQFQSGFASTSSISPEQIALIIQLVQMIISLWSKK